MNLTMMCYYRSSCLEFPVVLVGCQVEGCSRLLHHICQGEYEILNGIDFDRGSGRFVAIVSTSWGGESEVSKDMGDSTVAKKIELEEDEEYVEGQCLGVAVKR